MRVSLALAVASAVEPAAPPTPAELEATRTAQAEAAHRYRASLDALLPLREAAASRSARRRGLLAQGYSEYASLRCSRRLASGPL